MALDRLDIKEIANEAGIAVQDETKLPREAYSLLAQANLFRMRGCWDEAIHNCMAALRLAPDSPSAQSLLGDIYENQGRSDDAIQWYRMALDTNPDSPADHLKLNRLLERQRTPRHQIAEGKLLSSCPNTASQSASGLFRDLGRLVHDPETALRYGAMIAAMLVIFTVAFAYGAVHHRAALAALGLGNTQEVQIKPVVIPSAASSSADAATNVPHDAAEQTILDSLRHRSDLSAAGIRVFDVQADPRTARLSITVGLPSTNSLARAIILRSALQTIQDAVPLSPNSTVFTLRCLTLPAGADDTGGVSLVFVGDLARTSLPASADAALNDALVQTLFTDTWWSSQMPS